MKVRQAENTLSQLQEDVAMIGTAFSAPTGVGAISSSSPCHCASKWLSRLPSLPPLKMNFISFH